MNTSSIPSCCLSRLTVALQQYIPKFMQIDLLSIHAITVTSCPIIGTACICNGRTIAAHIQQTSRLGLHQSKAIFAEVYNRYYPCVVNGRDVLCLNLPRDIQVRAADRGVN